jgi:cyanophycinase
MTRPSRLLAGTALASAILSAAACMPPSARGGNDPSGGMANAAMTRDPIVGPKAGHVVVVGGGTMGPELYAKMMELAGGPDAPVVVVPTAGGDTTYPADWAGASGFKKAGAKNVFILHTIDRKVADSDAFVEPLKKAKLVWFGGGRQWHLVDSYTGTKTETEFRRVLERGGVVGGSSAGASILSSFLVRGARENNFIMMAPDYLVGFGYLRNVAIDQHVVARDRLMDMPQVIAKHPELLGISEDEGTAWVVTGDHAEIMGRNKAFVYNGKDATDPGQPYLTLRPGDTYDLGLRRVTHRAIDDAAITQRFVDSLMADYAKPGAPGATVLVAQDGRVLINSAYGLSDVASKTPLTTRSNFRLASMTKQFTAAAALLLVKDNKLKLDESLTDIWPDFPAYGKGITIKHLLQHTSGLRDYEDFVPDSQTRQVTDADVVAMMKKTDSVLSAPGAKYHYSNTGYAMLSEIVAKRGGTPFRSFLQRRIFTPVGMHKTVAYVKGDTALKFRAYGHSRDGANWKQTDQSNTSAVLGDGGIYSSVDELYRWDQTLNTDDLLSQTVLREAFTSGVTTDRQRTGYGYGWLTDTYRGAPRLYHTGSTIGFRNAIIRIPTLRATVIILTNRNEGEPIKIAEKIIDKLFFNASANDWQAQKVNSTSSCRSMSAPSAMVAWAGCTGGKVFRTTDGGATWSVDSVPGAARLDFRGIAAFDANTAVVASAGPAEQGQARIYRTTDGAKTWQLAWSDSTKGVFLDGLAFWDAQHGFTFSDPIDGKLVILTTADGGKSWQRTDPAKIPPVMANEAAFAASNTQLTTQGTSNGWIATGGGKEARVYRTTDRGQSWTVAGTGMPGGQSAGLFGIAFADDRNGLALGGDYDMTKGQPDWAIRTTDGGLTWKPASRINRPNVAVQGVALVRGARVPTFVATGGAGTAFSTDFGASWQHGDTLTSWAVSFPAPNAGYVAGARGHVAKFIGAKP